MEPMTGHLISFPIRDRTMHTSKHWLQSQTISFKCISYNCTSEHAVCPPQDSSSNLLYNQKWCTTTHIYTVVPAIKCQLLTQKCMNRLKEIYRCNCFYQYTDNGSLTNIPLCNTNINIRKKCKSNLISKFMSVSQGQHTSITAYLWHLLHFHLSARVISVQRGHIDMARPQVRSLLLQFA